MTLATGVAKHALSDRGNDLYETPPEAVRALLAAESLPHRIWEPCCGPGSIVRELRAAGHEVWASDLVDYESPDQDAVQWDFLFERDIPLISGAPVEAIVTNPPFKNAEAFVERALSLVPKVVMLCRLAFLESDKRRNILDSGQLARVHVFRNRLPMMHRDGQGITAPIRHNSSALAFAWFVWDADHIGPTALNRISWSAA